MTKELYLYEGSLEYNDELITEDRYIILDREGMDLYGQHFTEQEANEILNTNEIL